MLSAKALSFRICLVNLLGHPDVQLKRVVSYSDEYETTLTLRITYNFTHHRQNKIDAVCLQFLTYHLPLYK